MNIGGFQRFSLIDYPGKICAIVFTQGCNFRCPYCFTGNTEILTDRGLFKIEDIVETHIECRVYDYAGNFSPIKKYYERETSSLLEIRPFLHSDAISCTPNHEFFVYNSKANEFIKKEAQYINAKEDYLVIPIPQKEIFNYKLEVNNAIEDLYQELDKFIESTPKFMRLLGYYLSEGCSSKDKGRKNSYYVAFTFNSKEKEYIRDTKEIFSETFKTELKEVENKKCKTITLVSYRGIIGLFFKYYFGEDVYNKKIPTEFLYLDKSLQKQLIIGLFRGDGISSQSYIEKYRKQRIQITSKILLHQISLILLRLGIKHSMFRKEIIIADKKIFDILGQGHLVNKKSIDTSKRYGFIDNSYLYLRIKSINRIERREMVYNLEIGNPSHSYNVNLISVSNCHNPELVNPELFETPIPEKEVLSFLANRRGKLDAVEITGGEPTLQPDLIDFMSELKKLGYLVKLDSNGSNPGIISEVIEREIVDYIAMDVKAPLERYREITGSRVDPAKIEHSIELIMSSGLDYEFRTTVVKSQLGKRDILEIGRLIRGSKRYVLQKFVPVKVLDKKFLDEDEVFFYTDDELEYFRDAVERKGYVAECEVR
ncbi:MAG TPA: anaerobic ribonucleoside-triphosphate reductase activating protein [Methanophagales archaeon]|nr:anaerobic ribonucleoside-triphosphate reductase activating protein [Methanophagales archaeon]